MKIEKRLRDFYTSRGPKTKLYVWYCTNELYTQLYVCLPPLYIYIYIYIDISYIKCNVVTLSVCHLAEGNVGLHENKHKKRLAFLLSVEALLADRF
jgi:hypothetical protein